MLDSPEGVCPGQAQFEYPATSVLLKELGCRGLRWCEAAEDAQRYAGRWQTASMLLSSGSKTKAP
jgi:hypothetical protein